MILLVDIGNSNIVLAIVDNDKIVETFRLKSNIDKTSDEYYVSIKSILKDFNITDVMISSVVPVITSALKKVFTRLYKKEPYILGPGLKTGVMLKVDDPKTVGADIICDCAGVKGIADGAIVVDLGTANSLVYVQGNLPKDQKSHYLV